MLILHKSFQENFYVEIMSLPETAGSEHKMVDLSVVLKLYIQL